MSDDYRKNPLLAGLDAADKAICNMAIGANEAASKLFGNNDLGNYFKDNVKLIKQEMSGQQPTPPQTPTKHHSGKIER